MERVLFSFFFSPPPPPFYAREATRCLALAEQRLTQKVRLLSFTLSLFSRFFVYLFPSVFELPSTPHFKSTLFIFYLHSLREHIISGYVQIGDV